MTAADVFVGVDHRHVAATLAVADRRAEVEEVEV